MMCFTVLAMFLVCLFVLGLGFYALIAGHINLLRSSIHGPEARLLGLFLILFSVGCFVMLLRWLVGASMNLGH